MTQVPSVSELVGQIKATLESRFMRVAVEGEISNLTCSSTGHWYFTLSDSNSSISAALFKMDASRNLSIKKIKEGDRVICQGQVGVYAKRGTFQVIVKRITPVGKGDLKEELDKLKKKLAADGLFDLERKRPIPRLPKRIAIITAPGSAALQDFLNILKRRSFRYDILVSPAIVQGDTAPRSLRKALFNVIKYSLDCPLDKRPDVIVITRGGGSLEDLWAFNDEGLAWDIYNSPIPVVSAVGHEVDFSISDYVADLRCETPSAAAEVLSEYQVSVNENLEKVHRRLQYNLSQFQDRLESKIVRIHPKTILGQIWNLFHQYQNRLGRIRMLDRAGDYTRLNENSMRVDEAYGALNEYISSLSLEHGHHLDKMYEKLKLLDPNNVLGRGYSYVSSLDGKVLGNKKDFDKLDREASFKISFSDGDAYAKKTQSINDDEKTY